MISVQPYIDKLERLKEFIVWRIDTPDKVNSVEVNSDMTAAFKWCIIASVRTMTFEQYLKTTNQ